MAGSPALLAVPPIAVMLGLTIPLFRHICTVMKTGS